MENMLANYMGFYWFLSGDIERHAVLCVAGGEEVHSLQYSKGKTVFLAPSHCVMSFSGSCCHPSFLIYQYVQNQRLCPTPLSAGWASLSFRLAVPPLQY